MKCIDDECVNCVNGMKKISEESQKLLLSLLFLVTGEFLGIVYDALALFVLCWWA